MSIISKLTIRHLKENRKRTIVTILGIAMSTALITAMMVGVFSIFKFFGYVAVITEGDYHAGFSEVTAEQLEKLQSDDRIESIGITESDNERSGIKLNYGKEDRFSVGNIMHLNRAAFDQMITGDYEGTFPQNAGEIAVEQEFLDDNDLNLAIGDELEFTEGHRYTLDEDGDKIYWAGGYRSEEKFQEISRERCVITAILHGNRPSEGWDILRGLDGIPNEMGATIKLKKCDHTAIMQIKDIAKSIGATKYSRNTEYLLSVFAIEGSGAGITNLFTVFGIGLIIVVFTSVVLIYNAFGMSLAERVRYLGMLASVGATGRQKRGSVFFEGFILGIIGIPAGIILGIIGTTVTLNILGAQILESDMIAGAEGLRGSVPTVISPYVIAAIVLLAAVTIFISSFVPAFKASGIMPIDALRQSNIVRVRGRKLRVNPLIRRLFGYEGELAYKNIKRNGIKGTVIKLSIAISIIMFLAVNYICDSMTTFGNAYDLVLPYQVSASCSYDEIERLRNEVKGLNGVSDIYLTDFITYGFEKPGYEEKFTPANTDILNTDYLTKDYSDIYVSGAQNPEDIEGTRYVYLTFDDGPSSNTEEILNILDDYNVKATFFVCGKDLELYGDAYKRIVDDGHTIGMHSYSHNFGDIYSSGDAFAADYVKIHDLILNTTGVDTKYYRFPGGSSNKVSSTSMSTFINYLNEQGAVYYDWNVASGDATSQAFTSEQLVDNVMKDVVKYKTSVVLLHDAANKNATVEALPGLIESLQEQGAMILPITDETTIIQHVSVVQ